MFVFFRRNLLFVPVLLCVVNCSCPTHEQTRHLSSQCLPPLLRNLEHPDYAHCKNETCYLFIDEAPFIQLPKFSVNARHFKPFPCGQPHRMHPRLNGISFRIHAMTSSSTSSCVWAGPKATCSFNQLHDFAASFAKRGYRFALSGAFLDTPERRCRLQPSAPQLDSAMMIFGPNILAPAKSAFEQLTRPFRSGTWIALSVVTFFFAVIGMVIAVIVANRLSHTVYILMGHRDKLQDYNSRRLASSLAFLRGAMSSFAAICYFFYSASVVNFLFAQSHVDMSHTLSSLRVSDLSHYAVLKDSALEQVWVDAVNPSGYKFNSSDPSSFPWKRCLSGKECMEWAFRGTHDVQFAVTYKMLGNHFVHVLTDCNVLTEWPSRQPLPSFNIGWLYNREVTDTERMAINREIVGLRINGTISNLISRTKGDASCSEETAHAIGILVVLIPLAVLVFPLGIVGLSLIAWAEFERLKCEKRHIMETERDQVLPSAIGGTPHDSNLTRAVEQAT